MAPFGEGLPHATRAVTIARQRGLLSILPMALWAQANALVSLGRLNLARSAAEEGIRLASDSGHRSGARWNLTVVALLDALRGDEPAVRAHAEEAMQLAASSGATLIHGFAEWTLGLLDLTLGRPSEATDRLLSVASVDERESNPLIGLWSIPDLVEAAARSGRLGEVADRWERYVGWAQESSSPARQSVLARCRGLLGEGDARRQFETAITLGVPLSPFLQARTELLYGEWLRRERQKREARLHLRRAADLFHQVGVPPWESRAEAELRATGETTRRRDPSTFDQLTPQELQIAGLVASGMTNRQIAAALYLSPRTIDYHLRKVFSKLGLSSRTELVRMGVPRQEAV
jgi:DNA-binding CsgD family transcriptional regulator